MKTALHVRPAISSDLMKISFLLQNQFSQSYIRKLIHEESVLVAVLEHSVRGVALLSHSFFGDTLIQYLKVHPDYQNSKIASELLHHSEKLCYGQRLVVFLPHSEEKLHEALLKRSYVKSGIVHNINEEPQMCFVKDFRSKFEVKDLSSSIDDFQNFVAGKLVNLLQSKGGYNKIEEPPTPPTSSFRW